MLQSKLSLHIVNPGPNCDRRENFTLSTKHLDLGKINSVFLLCLSLITLTCLSQDIVGDGKPEALQESFKLDEFIGKIFQNLAANIYLESFLTVRFWPEWEVEILGGTENSQTITVYSSVLSRKLPPYSW